LEVVQKSEIRFSIIHADIAPEHIIINPETHRLSGIIDFGDVEIGDPAYDFAFLGRYGKEFLEKVYETYLPPRDEHFEARRQFYNNKQVVTNLHHSVVLKDNRLIMLHKKQLSEYIVARPL
ncbi:MAG: phosphotransferase, partial [Patescibacteria group bacterium]